MTGPSTAEDVRSKWWYWIVLQPLAVLGLILVWIVITASSGVPTGRVFAGETSLLAAVGGLYFYAVVVLHFVVLFAYVADTKAITNADNCEWNPSGVAYAGFALFFGSFAAVWYLRNRREHLGTP